MNIQVLRPFNEVSPALQKSVLKAAKNHEAAAWSAIEDQMKVVPGMTRQNLRAIRLAWRSCFERAAVMIFNERAGGADTWETWMHYLHLAQVELGFRPAGISDHGRPAYVTGEPQSLAATTV